MSVSKDKKLGDCPHLLCWVDLETTGLNAEEDLILELAYVLTEFGHPYRELERGAFLVRHRPEALANLDPFIQGMHERSGLLRDLLEHQEQALPLAEVEARLLDLSADWPPKADEDPRVVFEKSRVDAAARQRQVHTDAPKDVLDELAKVEEEARKAHREARRNARRRRVVLAGFSVAFDKGFLKKHLPSFHDRVSHRVFDASNLSLVCRSMGMPRVPRPAEDAQKGHRAGYDVKQSIELTRACVRWLLSLDAICKAGAKCDEARAKT